MLMHDGLFLGRSFFLNHSTSAHLATVTGYNGLFHVQFTMQKLLEMRMNLYYGFEGRVAPGSYKLSVWLSCLYRSWSLIVLGSWAHGVGAAVFTMLLGLQFVLCLEERRLWLVGSMVVSVVSCTLRACWLSGSPLLTCVSSPKCRLSFFSPSLPW